MVDKIPSLPTHEKDDEKLQDTPASMTTIETSSKPLTPVV
jgi:hypothetical protein